MKLHTVVELRGLTYNEALRIKKELKSFHRAAAKEVAIAESTRSFGQRWCLRTEDGAAAKYLEHAADRYTAEERSNETDI